MTVPTAPHDAEALLVRPLAVGVCGTDLQILGGHRPDAAAILGHEGLASVVAAGSGAAGFRVGDTVVFNPVNPAAQSEILGHSVNGIFQQKRVVSAAELAWGLVVPVCVPSLDPVLGTLVEPVAAVLYGFELVEQVVRPRTVAVVGAGPIGLLAVLAAQDRGAERVLLVTNNTRRREWIKEHSILPEQDILVVDDSDGLSARACAAAEDVDALFLCTPRSAAIQMLEAMLPAVRDGGCIDLVGGFADGDCIASLPGFQPNAVRRSNVCGAPQPGVTVEWPCVNGKRVHLTGHRGTNARHLAMAQAMLFRQPKRYGVVITHRCSLEAAPELLSRLLTRSGCDGESELVKGVVDLRLEGHILEAAGTLHRDGWEN